MAGAAHADIDRGVSLYAPHGSTSGGSPLYLNPQAFTVPGYDNGTNTCSAIGRFGNGGVGNVVGPGTKAVSMSFVKSVSLVEKAKLQVGAEISNLFNHPNYAPPNMSVTPGSNTMALVRLALYRPPKGSVRG